MDAERAWQSALGQLQMEMPKASFDTWVRDTRLLSVEDGVVTISARNEYAREWLENRLSSTVSRLMMGIMNQDVSVVFVATTENPDEGEKSEGGPDLEDDDQLSVDVVRSTAYREAVEPDKVIVLPGYSLRLLWNGEVEPKGMSLWVGFHQAVWRDWKNGKGSIHNISNRAVCEFGMMSRAAFFEEIAALPIYQPGAALPAGQAPLPMRGLVERIPIDEKKRHYQNKRGRLRTIANRYRVYMDPRLANPDAVALYEKLKAATAGLSGKACAGAATKLLLELCQVPPDKYLPKLEDDPPTTILPANTVMDVVRLLPGLTGEPSKELSDAAEILHDKIIGGFGLLYMTQYFTRVAAPRLGLTHPQIWLINAVRDRTWRDPVTGATRDYVIFENGYKDLGRMIGCQTRTVRAWLSDDEKGRPRSAVSCFVAEVGFDETAFRNEEPDRFTEWRDKGTIVLEVRREEPVIDPTRSDTFSPNHGGKRLPRKCTDCGTDTWVNGEAFILKATVRKAARKDQSDKIGIRKDQVLCVACAETRLRRDLVQDDFEDMVAQKRRSARLKKRAGDFESPTGELETLVDANLRLRSRELETPISGELETLVDANLRLARRELETPFKSLNLLNQNSKDSPHPLSPPNVQSDRPAPVAGRVGELAYWDFNFLMQNNSVRNVGLILKVQKANDVDIKKVSQRFVSWLLYGYCPLGQRIDDPVALAVKRLRESVFLGAGGDIDRLAELRPYQLKAIFDKDFAGKLSVESECSLEEEMYVVNFKDLDDTRKRKLYRSLFGSA